MTELFDPLFIIKTLGLIGIFAVVFVESGFFFGFFFPGDSLLFTAGFLASQGYFSLSLLMFGCVAATFLGGAFGYWFGRHVGPSIFSRENSFFFRKKRLEEAQSYYERHGKKTIIIARFIPVVRTFAPILAGVGQMRYRAFLSFNLLGAILWTVLLCLLGFYLGKVIPDVERYILPVITVIIIVSFIPAIFTILRRKKGQVPAQ